MDDMRPKVLPISELMEVNNGCSTMIESLRGLK